MNDEILLVVDSNYICHVMKYAHSQGLTYRGTRTEIIYGFLRQIFSLMKQFETNKIVFCWDSLFSKREEIYPIYKANRHREKTEEEKEQDGLAFEQFDKLRSEILPNIGFKNVFQQKGYEGDDLLAEVVHKWKLKKKIVVSNDEDLFQLLDYCSLYNISKHALTTKTIFQRQYNITPSEWIKVKQIGGCSGDNVIGIEGVGVNKAIGYLKNELPKNGKVYPRIISPEGQKIINRNKILVELPFPGVKIPKEIIPDKITEEKIMRVCKDYGLKSLITDSNITALI